MHFFSPVHEDAAARGDRHAGRPSREVTATAVAYGKKLGKTVIVVNDAPGFYANRILAPYINEAGILLDEGAAIDAIDRALVEFGFPGRADHARSTKSASTSPASPARSCTRRSAADGAVAVAARASWRPAGPGGKGKKGFYRYDETGKKRGVDPSVYELLAGGSTASRVARGRDSAALRARDGERGGRCLQEGILRSLARRRRRRGVRDRLPAVPRRPVPLRRLVGAERVGTRARGPEHGSRAPIRAGAAAHRDGA